MSKLTLDNNHVYTFNGRVVPGVTSILEKVFGSRPYWSEWHAQKGTAIHRAIHLYLQGKLNWNTVDARIKGRINAFTRFLAETGCSPKETELQLVSQRYRFAGTLDLIAEPKDKFVDILFDIKPPQPEPIVEIQLGGYSLLCEENKVANIKQAAALCLRDNGTYNLKWVPDLRQAQNVFLACLTVNNWKVSHY